MRLSASDLSPPAELLEIADTLESRGFQAWAVGGAIRDELLGQSRKDWDLATDARPEDVRGVFRRTVPLGIEHGTVGVIAPGGTMFEVTTFRRDIETDGRHAVVEFADTIDEDLARRDFTINAIAWRPATEELADPWNGRADLEQRILRAVGDPTQRVAEDYLRVLRGLRFAGRYRLEIEPGTRTALESGVEGTAGLSAERVREELEKVLAGPQPSVALGLYAELGVLHIWYPEIASASGHARWAFDLAAVDALPAEPPELRLTRWLLSAAEVDRSREEDAETAGDTRAGLGATMLRRLRCSNATIHRVTHLMRHYLPMVGPLDSAARIREWLSEVGVESASTLFELHLAYARAARATETERYLQAARQRVEEEIGGAPPLELADLAIGGEELLALGVQEGPAIGILLHELHARVLEDPDLNDPGTQAELARELIEIGGLGRGGSSRR